MRQRKKCLASSKALESEYISYGECRLSLLQVESRLQDELGSIILYSVNQENSECLSEKPLFGMSVFEAFPKSNTDIMEAGKCLCVRATHRSGLASNEGFHDASA